VKHCLSKVTLDRTVQDIKCANTTQGNYLFKYMEAFISYSKHN